MESREIRARVLFTRKGMPRTFMSSPAPHLYPLKMYAKGLARYATRKGGVISICLDDKGCQVLAPRLGNFYVDREEFPDPFVFDHIEDPKDFLAYILSIYREMTHAH